MVGRPAPAMSAPEDPMPSQVVERLAADRPDEPILMLNLLKFNPGGAALFAEYGRRTAAMLEAAGGRIALAGRPAHALVGDADWDLVLVVAYRTRRSLVAFLASDGYKAVEDLRTRALARSELIAMDPTDDWR
jgi:uncharacterized protein (DUF1330 family)